MSSTNNFSAPTPRQNTLNAALAHACRQEPLAEKWLLCPSRRVGQQWLETLTRTGQPVVNLRLHTLTSFALELAGPDLAAGHQLLSPLGRVVLAARQLRELDTDYLGGLRPSLALAERLAATLRDLRLAGLEPADLERGQFESETKGRELRHLLTAYRLALAEQHLDDEADLLRRARAQALPAGVVLLVPADLELTALERELLAGIPTTRLPFDEPRPDFAPTVTFRAIGETNELRHVLRHCLANGWPLDQVELLHTDSATYVPALYELAENLQFPVTFADGLPVRLTRPGRALAAWLDWIATDYPQPALIALIRDDLLTNLPAAQAARLRPVPIGFGRDRYLPKLDEYLADLDPRREALAEVRAPLATLLQLAAQPALTSAAEFLRSQARCANEFDNYARDVLLERLAELVASGADSPEWLPSLLRDTRVLGLGPRPGHLHIAGIETGGHSGREHTFIVGLDANRFPAAGRPDPVLLDGERRQLSPQLSTAADQRDRSAQNFARLCARLCGTVTWSYSCRDLAGDAELFPGVPVPASLTAALAPARETEALSETEWWLWRLCATPVNAPAELVGACYPELARGQRAAQQRAGEAFTEFDGYVAEALPEQVYSPHRLEMLGTCPLKYFYRYGLGLELPEELAVDRRQWLPAEEFGLLLHDVFCRAVRDGGILQEILAERIAHYREKFPPPSAGVFRHEVRRLERSVKIFAQWEAGRALDWERELQAPVSLPDGTTIPVRGRIDRVDDLEVGLALWDYKTGSPGRFAGTRKDPFLEGRVLQHALYLELARQHYGRPVAQFGYFFPTEKGHAEELTFKPAQLAGAPRVLGWLHELVARGVFPATTTTADCAFCDYRGICRDVNAVVAQSNEKLAEPGNTQLQPFRGLRA